MCCMFRTFAHLGTHFSSHCPGRLKAASLGSGNLARAFGQNRPQLRLSKTLNTLLCLCPLTVFQPGVWTISGPLQWMEQDAIINDATSQSSALPQPFQFPCPFSNRRCNLDCPWHPCGHLANEPQMSPQHLTASDVLC
jgi:hypothetical protein